MCKYDTFIIEDPWTEPVIYQVIPNSLTPPPNLVKKSKSDLALQIEGLNEVNNTDSYRERFKKSLSFNRPKTGLGNWIKGSTHISNTTLETFPEEHLQKTQLASDIFGQNDESVQISPDGSEVELVTITTKKGTEVQPKENYNIEYLKSKKLIYNLEIIAKERPYTIRQIQRRNPSFNQLQESIMERKESLTIQEKIQNKTFPSNSKIVPITLEKEKHDRRRPASWDFINQHQFDSQLVTRSLSCSTLEIETILACVGKRKLEVLVQRNNPEQRYGVLLTEFEGRHVIVCVCKDHPAEEAGLEFGDEIECVNGRPVDGTQVGETLQEINSDNKTILLINKDAFVTKHVVHKPEKNEAVSTFWGIWLREGVIISVDEGSACWKAGLKKGQVLIYINEHLTFGLPHEEIASLIVNSRSSTTVFRTMSLQQFRIMMKGINLQAVFGAMTGPKLYYE